MKKTGRAFFIVIAALFAANLALMSFSLYIFNQPQQKNPDAERGVPGSLSRPSGDPLSVLSLEGFVKAEIDLRPNGVVVKDGCRGVLMMPTEQQLRSIASAITNESDVRPSTHDLMKEVLETYGIQVVQSKIVDAEEDEEIYYARLIVKKGDKLLNLDSKPSDAIAVGLRAGVPLYIKKSILEKKGQDVCSGIA